MTTPVTADPIDAPAPAKPASVWEDLIDIFTEPRAVFARRRDGRFWLPLLVYTLIAAATFYVGRPVIQPALQRQEAASIAKIEADPRTSAEQKAQAVAFVRGSSDSPWAAALPVAIVPIATFVTALTLWLIGKGFGSGATLGQAMAVTSIGGIPRAALGLVVAGVSLAIGRQSETMYGFSAGPALFATAETSPVLAAVLSRLDVGVLWHTVLLGIGLAMMGRVTRRLGGPVVEGQISQGKGLAAAFIVWVLAGLMTVWQVMQQAAV